MSIIEKALEKSESKGGARRDRAPADGQRDEQHQATATPGSRTSVEKSPSQRSQRPATAVSGRSSHANTVPRPDTAPPKIPKAPVEDEWKDDRKRPEFPRKTLKQVALDFERLDSAGIITPESTNTALLEQFRIIKRPLLRNAAPGSVNRVPNGNLLLVTSAVAGEGKTYTAINLAMSIATELDRTVLLVDADPHTSDD